MPEQSKFENMDLFASLEAIMKQNTGFYQSDLDIDKEIIAKAAASPHREDKTLLWFCRPSGTHCFRERDVFLKDTAPHNTWRFYMEQTSDRVLAYAIELTGKERGKIKGNLYELDYSKHYERVKEKELPADTVKLIYEHGERVQEAGRYFDGTPDPQLGKFERFEAVPNDPDALQSLLQEERRSREQLSPGDFKAHIAALRDGLIETEARRIVREMKRHYEPNSPNKTHFMAELSPAFMRLAATKDTDRLFSMLPYKTLSFSKIEGRHGTYALIDKGENRDREIGAFALNGQTEDTPHHGGSFFVDQPMVFVFRVFLVAIDSTVGSGLAGFALDADGGFLLAAQVAQIPLVHDIEEGGKLIAVLVVAVHAVGNGDKVDAVLPEEYLRVKAGLQIVAPRPAHIFDDHMGNLACLNIRDKLFPCRTLEIAAAPAVVRIVPTVGVASLLGIAFEIFFLIHDGIAIPGVVIVTGQPLIESGNFAFSLFHAHDALLSDCRLICGASIIP